MNKLNRRKFIYTGITGTLGTSVYAGGFKNLLSPHDLNENELFPHAAPMVKSNVLEIPKLMNMGFHYTTQYSRRTRINVMGLVDHSTDEWERWYYKTHEFDAVKKMADAGYKILEIHFMYGFGIKGEKPEYELTKKMVENAHKLGMKVFGYLQFFSVQKELFFLENPWAKDCLQLKADGTPHVYNYDRPALCFTNKEVQQYYLDAIEIGLTYCDLDGIRLDNDYFRGCFCNLCQKEFNEYLNRKFTPALAKRVFGLETLNGMELVPVDRTSSGSINDPLYLEMVKFRMWQRQKMMKLLHDKIVSVKPEAILGGNPAITRLPNDSVRVHVYIPDLGKTHNLVCAENSLFPERLGDSIKHQVVAYKYGQSNNFKVFPSHHLHTPDNKTRWPETKEECALSLCEALAFGGHVPCTTWGIRMDGSENKTLWERPHFLEALTPVKEFLEKYDTIYKNNISTARIGIYLNRETQIADITAYWHSFQGIVQLFLQNKIPFRFVDEDNDDKLKGLKILFIGNVRLVSDEQLNRFMEFAKTGKIIMTGESCFYDEYFLIRKPGALDNLHNHKNVTWLKNTPERVTSGSVKYLAQSRYLTVPVPPRGDDILKIIREFDAPDVQVNATPFVTIDTFVNDKNESFIHILNYDNVTPQDVEISIDRRVKVQVLSPGILGCVDSETSIKDGKTKVKLKKLHTYAVLRYV